MLLSSFIHSSISELETIYPSPEARALVLKLCCEILGVQNYTHIIEPLTEIPEEKLEALRLSVRRLSEGEPIQYILGFADFRNHKFRVSPSVLIPRPETEQLVDLVLEALPQGGKVLDLCTGSGCIAWSIALERADAQIVAVDISRDALSIARKQFGFTPSISFVEADILNLNSLKDLAPDFDVVVSNPPYIMESQKTSMQKNILDFEPELALFVPDTNPLVFYEAVAYWSNRLLKDGGKGFVEINDLLADQNVELFKKANFQKSCKISDYFSRNRFISFNR